MQRYVNIYRVNIRTHVVEGICIPLDVRHDLNCKKCYNQRSWPW